MISETALDLAVTRNILSAAQADDLRALARAEAEHIRASLPPPPMPAVETGADAADDEKLRFVTGFADIFVTIGIALFCGAAADIAAHYAGGLAKWAVAPVLAWVLAEFFTRRHRMALPSIVLLLLFTVGIFNFIATLMTPGDAGPYLVRRFQHPGMWPGMDSRTALSAGVLTAASAALHYWRFRVPITIAAGAAALCIAFVAAIHWIVPSLGKNAYEALLLLCGLGVFALAMRFDMRDPARRTRNTDIAFWLHLLAAPLIVHPLIALFRENFAFDTRASLAILGVFLVFAVISLVIDRRALLVSGLAYAGFAFNALVREVGLTGAVGLTSSTLLVVGLFILLLSAGWRPLRNTLLRFLPQGFARRLPHPRTQMS